MNKTRIILVGGFLGSGKTTLIWRVAERLIKEGKRVGLVTNDQAPELVDSQLLRHQQLSVGEVAGSCFCCNFTGFTDAVSNIREQVKADYILAEPVGSCADLSATILQPLKKFWNTELTVSPLTVLADPKRLDALLNDKDTGLHEDAAYIFRKQLEEADIIAITKTDTISPKQLSKLADCTRKTFPECQVMALSAMNGDGLEEWVQDVVSRSDAGSRLLDIDYDRYAHGEAVLGWLNGTVGLTSAQPAAWDGLLSSFMQQLLKNLEKEALPVGHVKVIAENGKNYSVANITGAERTLTMREGAGDSNEVRLIINARVECSPEHLDFLVRDALLQSIDGRYTDKVYAWRYLQPGRPNPTHRFGSVVR